MLRNRLKRERPMHLSFAIYEHVMSSGEYVKTFLVELSSASAKVKIANSALCAIHAGVGSAPIRRHAQNFADVTCRSFCLRLFCRINSSDILAIVRNNLFPTSPVSLNPSPLLSGSITLKNIAPFSSRPSRLGPAAVINDRNHNLDANPQPRRHGSKPADAVAVAGRG